MNPIHITSAGLALLALAAASNAQQMVYESLGSTGDNLGRSLAGIGDVDGDGHDDYAVGRPLYDSVFSIDIGRVDVYSGRTGVLIRAHYGESSGDQFGYSIDGLGDMDADGFDDYIIGAPRYDHPSAADSGKVYLRSGRTGTALVSIVLVQAGAQTGFSVCGTGDVDLDGVPDFAFGLPYYDDFTQSLSNAGRIVVESGATFTSLWAVTGTSAGGRLGFSLDVVGDITGDGRPEIVVGAPNEDVFVTNSGRAYVLNGLNGTTVFSRFGAWAGSLMGYDVAGIGDVDGDGHPDVAFGEPFSDQNGTNSGRVLISSGAPPYLQLYNLNGPAGVQTGTAVSGIGDADGDGVPDLAVGMPYANFFGATDVGWIWLVSGASGTPFQTLIGTADGDRLGTALDGVGDLNHDGFADVILGSPYSDVAGANAGVARVFLTKVINPSTYCTAKVNSAGCTPEIGWVGTASASIANDFHVTANNILYNTPGLLIWSVGSASTPFGGGTLCLAPPIRRTPGQSAGGLFGVACSGSFDFHFNHAYMAAKGLTPGTQLHAQYWSRDSGFGAPNNVNLTDALEFTILN